MSCHHKHPKTTAKQMSSGLPAPPSYMEIQESTASSSITSASQAPPQMTPQSSKNPPNKCLQDCQHHPDTWKFMHLLASHQLHRLHPFLWIYLIHCFPRERYHLINVPPMFRVTQHWEWTIQIGLPLLQDPNQPYENRKSPPVQACLHQNRQSPQV